MPKSCLRIPTPPMTPASPPGDCSHRRKCVAFCAEELEKIYIADEWDRTPTEVAHKLSYGDVLELKAIQRSLPTVPQLPDPLARRPHSQFLKGVPIGLLPMYDDSQPCNSVAATALPMSPPPELPPVPSRSPSIPSRTPSPSIPSTTSLPSSFNGTSEPSIPPVLLSAHSTPTSPTSPYPPRPKPTFTFLPLLDTPAVTQPPPPISVAAATPPPAPPSSEADTDDSDHDLSTPALSHASLDTTPSPREDSFDHEYGYFQLPPRRAPPPTTSYFPPQLPATQPKQSLKSLNPALLTPSPFSLYAAPSIVSKSATVKKSFEESYSLDINGETFHFGPASTPPDSPSSPLSPLSPTLSPSQASSPPKYKPFFAFEQERGQDLPASLSRSTVRKSTSPHSPRGKDLHPPSPILAPYCVSMKRGRPGSPCSPVRSVRADSTVGRKGNLEH